MSLDLSYYKVVFIGDSGVGKTSIIKRINNDGSMANEPTIASEYYSYTSDYDNKKICMNIWDTAGQEKFRSISKIYYRDSCAAIAVFDLTQAQSLEKLKSWINEYREVSGNEFVLIVGNKCDRQDDIVISQSTTKEFADSLNADYIWVSAKTGFNINEIITELSKHLSQIDNTNKQEQIIISEENQPKPKSCCK